MLARLYSLPLVQCSTGMRSALFHSSAELGYGRPNSHGGCGGSCPDGLGRGGEDTGMSAVSAAVKGNGALIVLLLIVFINIAGFGIVIPLLPFYAESFG